MAGVIPFCWTMKKIGFIDKLIWDQHKFPANKLFLINACESIVVANKERCDFLFHLKKPPSLKVAMGKWFYH